MNVRHAFQSLLILVFTLGFFSNGHAQNSNLVVQSDQTVEWYVQNVLVGAGVQVSNITFNGMPGNAVELQCGYFQSNGSYVDLESGLVLSSGDVFGTNFNGDTIIVGQQTSISVTNGVDGDPDLETLANDPINDQAVLEFDFIPTGDTLRFNYVFGSEEYPEYVNSFNDAFGFFLSGPGIAGPYTSPAAFPGGAANIALIPGTTTPVTIDNVNNGDFNCPGPPTGPCMNCAFYVDNCAIADSAMDGMTTVLEAFALVQCGQTYHIKLAIGDAVDSAFDSAVFLQEGSFESSLAISADLFSSIGPNLDGILYENCGFGVLTFSRSAGIDDQAIVELEITGTAINGIDFTNIPSTITFQPGDTIVTLNVSAIIDGLAEGEESCTLTITNTAVSSCSGSITSSFDFIVSDDPEPLDVSSIDYDIECGDTILIESIVTGGYGQYDYHWTPNLPNTGSPIVSPGFTTDYYLQITDTCNSVATYDTITVTVPVWPPVEATVDDNNIELDCLQDTLLVPSSVTGGNLVYNYEWYENGQLIGDDYSVVYTGGVSSQLTFIAFDGCGQQDVEIIDVYVEEIPLVVTASADTIICAEQSVDVSVDVTGGEAPYLFSWSYADHVTPAITVSPQESTQYVVSVTDLCGNVESDNVNVGVANATAKFFMAESGYYGIDISNYSSTDNSDTLMYMWDFGDGATSVEFEPLHQFINFDENEVKLVVTNEHGCVDSVSYMSNPPESIYVPSSFSPNGDGLNDHFKVVAKELVSYELYIFDQWGRNVFYTEDVNMMWNGRNAQDSEYFGQNEVYVYRIRARAENGKRYDMVGTIALVR